MTKLRRFALFVVFGHWFIAILHLFLAANVLAAPNDKVSWLAISIYIDGTFGCGHCFVDAWG